MFYQKNTLLCRCVTGSLFSALLIVLLISCSSGNSDKEVKENFLVTNPIRKDTLYTNAFVADIHSLQNVEIRARVRGFVEDIHVDEGQYVKAGQLLFSISSQEYAQEVLKMKAMLASAIADAKAAEVDLKNVKTLVDKNVVSKSDLEMTQAKLDAFNAKIEEAKAHESSSNLQLSFTKIRAPFSGVINRIPNKVGSLIGEGTLLTTLSDNKEVFAYFNVSEKEYLNFISRKDANDQIEVSLELANNKLHPYKGKIEIIEGEVDKSTGNIAFRARFPNPELVLKHGSSGKIQLTTQIPDALLVPQKATFEIQDNLYVYVVDDKNVVQLRSIKPSFRIPHFYLLESGLSVNDRIIYEGLQRVQEGDEIIPEVFTMNQILLQLAKQ